MAEKNSSKQQEKKPKEAEQAPQKVDSVAKTPADQRKQGKTLMMGGLLLLALALCCMATLDHNSETPTNQMVEEEEMTANCTATECLAKLETTDTPEKITEVIGAEPEDRGNGEYKWKISSKESVAREKAGDGYILQATVDKAKIAQEGLNFGIFTDLKKQLEQGQSFTYAELVEKIGAEGTLAGKTSSSKRYIWVDNHERTFGATFSDEDGQCSIISLN